MEEVVIEGFVDGAVVVTGTSDPVNGIVNGSFVITCNGIDEKRIRLIRGFIPMPAYDLNIGDFYIKNVADNYLTLNKQLVSGEYIYIKTIPVIE